VQQNAVTARVGIDTLIFLKQTLKQVPRIEATVAVLLGEEDNSLGPEATALLKAMLGVFRNPLISEMNSYVEGILTDSTSVSKFVDDVIYRPI
jgi:hypothetical protein